MDGILGSLLPDLVQGITKLLVSLRHNQTDQRCQANVGPRQWGPGSGTSSQVLLIECRPMVLKK